MLNNKIKAAFDHVKKYHPEVVIVVYNHDSRWQFMDADFKSPVFGSEIDVGLLEDAADSLEVLPFVYQPF